MCNLLNLVKRFLIVQSYYQQHQIASVTSSSDLSFCLEQCPVNHLVYRILTVKSNT